MGGRGGSSASAKRGSLIGSAAAMSAKDWNELNSVASANGIHLKDSLKTIPLETAKTALAGVIDVSEQFPQADKKFFSLGAERENNSSMAWASFSNGITVNSKYYSSQEKLDACVKEDFSSKFTASSQPRGLTAHEAGHMLEAALINKKYNGEAGYAALSDWNKSTLASSIVSRASKNVKKTAEGKGMKIADQIKQVSRYAAANRSETLAECVADCITNGNNAKLLSKEVWNILKQELG